MSTLLRYMLKWWNSLVSSIRPIVLLYSKMFILYYYINFPALAEYVLGWVCIGLHIKSIVQNFSYIERTENLLLSKKLLIFYCNVQSHVISLEASSAPWYQCHILLNISFYHSIKISMVICPRFMISCLS